MYFPSIKVLLLGTGIFSGCGAGFTGSGLTGFSCIGFIAVVGVESALLSLFISAEGVIKVSSLVLVGFITSLIILLSGSGLLFFEARFFVCGSGDYDFKTEEEAKDAIRMLSRNDTRFMDRFKIERHDVSPEHKFWTLEALGKQIIKYDEEWACQSHFIAADVDAYCKNMLRNRSNLL